MLIIEIEIIPEVRAEPKQLPKMFPESWLDCLISKTLYLYWVSEEQMSYHK